MEYLSCASRARNPDNPSERGRSYGRYRQSIEVNRKGVSNTVASVLKDYLIMEIHQSESKSNATTTAAKDSILPKLYEPKCLSLYRTDYGRKVWNDYAKKHKIRMNRKAMLCLLPRHDGLFRTITTLQSDIQIMETRNNKGRLITAEIAAQLKLPEEYIGKRFRIRKLTPRECFRLMDVDEENIDKLLNAKNEKGQQLISNSQCYKMAGNSIVVSCMEYIFKNLFIETPKEDKTPIQLKLF